MWQLNFLYLFSRVHDMYIIILPCVRTTDDASCTQLHISRNRNICHVRPVIRHTVDTWDHLVTVFVGIHTEYRETACIIAETWL